MGGPSSKAKYSWLTDSEPVPWGKGEKNPCEGSEIEPKTVCIQAVGARPLNRFEDHMTFYYVYVLQNVANQNDYYIGYTTNIKARLAAHNSNQNPSTRGRTWKIVYCEAYISEQVARKRENTIKNNGRMRTFLMNRIKSQFNTNASKLD